MRSKYLNKKITVDGIQFDSKAEAHRFTELKLLQRSGAITDLRLQVPYELIPAQYVPSGEFYVKGYKAGQPKMKCVECQVKYIADFVYTENGQTVVEDVKGYVHGGAYEIFKIKRKLMLYRYGIQIKEIK